VEYAADWSQFHLPPPNAIGGGCQNLPGDRSRHRGDADHNHRAKGDENWQIARDKGTKAAGDIKVGSKVTVYYKMTATEIEVKDAAKNYKGEEVAFRTRCSRRGEEAESRTTGRSVSLRLLTSAAIVLGGYEDSPSSPRSLRTILSSR
jgi:hypothetical protein